MAFSDKRGVSNVSSTADPAEDYVPISPGTSELAGGLCRAILCSEDGTLNLTNALGVEREDIPVGKGINPLSALIIDDPTTGTAPGVVVALY